MALIDKETIRAEIERRISVSRGKFLHLEDSPSKDFHEGRAAGLCGLLSFIESLPEEDPSEDLEKAAEEYHNAALRHILDDSPIGTVKDAFIAGAEWKEERMMKDYNWLIPVSSNIELKADIVHTTNSAPIDDGKAMLHVADKSYKIGWRDCKYEMMKEAVEGTYSVGNWGVPCIELPAPLNAERFDEVKIIIVKED